MLKGLIRALGAVISLPINIIMFLRIPDKERERKRPGDGGGGAGVGERRGGGG